ncbi:MAG TPA: FUSC family protein [Candidatus Methylacidiphilales bacterium]|nr:FUSC family protein [Candidatus Methylacidiphilales bacterium]
MARFEFLPVGWRDAFGFGLRNWLACMLALYTAFQLQIDEPFWAALTVWQSIQPTPGTAISRGFYRIVGVVIGGIMGIVLIALFAQAPEMFILALALWVGACTIAATLLTNFRGFAGVSAGFMTVLVSMDSYNMQDKVFDIAMQRGSATIIGVVCSVLVTVVFAPHRAQGQLVTSIRKAMSDAARRAAFPLERPMAERFAIAPAMAGSLVKLETVIEFASDESPAGRRSARPARSFIAHLFAVITAKRAMEEHLARVGLTQEPGTVALYKEGMALFDQFPALVTANREAEIPAMTQAFGQKVRAHQPQNFANDEQAISSQMVLDRLDALAENYGRAVEIWLDIQAGRKGHPDVQLNFHRDRQAAAINAVRSFLAVMAGGVFWIESQWPAGPDFMIPIVIGSSSFAAAPFPEKAALGFAKGAFCGSVATYICTYHFLANTSGFVPFALSQALFLIPAAMLGLLNPKYMSFALAYGTFFFLVSATSNPMDYNPQDFFNTASGIVAGALLATLAFRLFMPPNPQRARRYVVSRMRDGLKKVAEMKRIPDYSEWQTRNFDRVYRLSNPENPSAVKTFEWYEGGVATVHLGNEILRLRHVLAENALPEGMAKIGQSVLRAFGRISTDLPSTRLAIDAAVADLGKIPPPADDRRQAWMRFRSAVEEMQAFFVAWPRFLTPR